MAPPKCHKVPLLVPEGDVASSLTLTRCLSPPSQGLLNWGRPNPMVTAVDCFPVLHSTVGARGENTLTSNSQSRGSVWVMCQSWTNYLWPVEQNLDEKGLWLAQGAHPGTINHCQEVEHYGAIVCIRHLLLDQLMWPLLHRNCDSPMETLFCWCQHRERGCCSQLLQGAGQTKE